MNSVIWLKHTCRFLRVAIVFVLNVMARIVVPGLLFGVSKVVMDQNGTNSENDIASLK